MTKISMKYDNCIESFVLARVSWILLVLCQVKPILCQQDTAKWQSKNRCDISSSTWYHKAHSIDLAGLQSFGDTTLFWCLIYPSRPARQKTSVVGCILTCLNYQSFLLWRKSKWPPYTYWSNLPINEKVHHEFVIIILMG